MFVICNTMSVSQLCSTIIYGLSFMADEMCVFGFKAKYNHRNMFLKSHTRHTCCHCGLYARQCNKILIHDIFLKGDLNSLFRYILQHVQVKNRPKYAHTVQRAHFPFHTIMLGF